MVVFVVREGLTVYEIKHRISTVTVHNRLRSPCSHVYVHVVCSTSTPVTDGYFCCKGRTYCVRKEA